MHPMPDDYKEAMQAQTRQVDVYLAVGVNVDQTAADDITEVTCDALPMSNLGQLADAIYEIEPGLATFESYGIPSDPERGMIAPPLESVAYPPEISIWSDAISDVDGVMDWSFTVTLSQAHTSALTVFTREVAITEADITFYNGEDVAASGPMEAVTDGVQYVEAVTFDRFTVHITRLEAPFRHARIVELEFGASRTFSKANLTGTVSIIQETDPTMQTIPLYELDFTVLNVMGEWDVDNPVGKFDDIRVGHPIVAGFTCTDGAKKYTVPMGRFIIAEKKGSDTELSVVCYDPRKVLQDIHMEWSISAEQNLGASLTDLFTEVRIPHIIESEVFEITPDNDATFSAEQSLLDAMRHIQQYYNVWLVPERDGSVHARVGPPTGQYGTMSSDMMYSYPLAYSFTKYNFIQVSYGPQDALQYHNLDLRESSSEVKTQITVTNPLILTQDKAATVATRIASALYSQMVEVEWRADLLNDIGDVMGLAGRWTPTSPTDYRCVYNDIEYNGGLTARTRGTV